MRQRSTSPETRTGATGAAAHPKLGNRHVLVVLALVAGSWLYAPAAEAQPWWNQGWKRRIRLTFNNAAQGSNLINVPVLVVLNGSRVSYSEIQAAGQDIRFLDANGTTVLNHEIETWNAAGSSYVWVRVPQVDASSTIDHIWMYYRNPTAPDAQNAPGVWSNGYVGVWHFKEDPSGPAPQMRDSTANANHGTSGGAMVTADQVPGRIAGSLRFDGINDLVNAGTAASLADLGPLTASAWIRPNTAGGSGSGKIFAKYVTSITGRWMLELDNTAPEVDAFEFTKGYDVTDISRIASNGTVSYGAWQHMVATWDGSNTATNVRIFKNGAELGYQSATNGANAKVSDAALPLVIGNRGDGGVGFDGLIDEARLSNVVRSPDWIAAQHLPMTDTYITYGAPSGLHQLSIHRHPGRYHHGHHHGDGGLRRGDGCHHRLGVGEPGPRRPHRHRRRRLHDPLGGLGDAAHPDDPGGEQFRGRISHLAPLQFPDDGAPGLGGLHRRQDGLSLQSRRKQQSRHGRPQRSGHRLRRQRLHRRAEVHGRDHRCVSQNHADGGRWKPPLRSSGRRSRGQCWRSRHRRHPGQFRHRGVARARRRESRDRRQVGTDEPADRQEQPHPELGERGDAFHFRKPESRDL